MRRLTRWLKGTTSAHPTTPELRIETLESREVPATFTNSAGITINDMAAANPFPAQISVSGMGTSLTGISVTLNGFSHSISLDADVLLVGPGGQKVMLMSDCGTGASGANLTFQDGAAALPGGGMLVSGTYAPTNRDVGTPDDFVTYGGPAGPYGAFLSAFNGTDPNGVWSLYVIDELAGASGAIAGGWTLNLSTGPSVTSVAPPPAGGYGTGSNLTFVVTFDQAVTVDTTGGTPRLVLDVGGQTRYATYRSGSGSTALEFRYTIQAGDSDANGINLTSPLDVNGGTIRNATSDDADPGFTPPNTSGVTVDTARPSVSLSTIAPLATNTRLIPVTATFSEAVKSLTAANLSVTNATVTNFVKVSGSVYTFDLIPVADGLVTVQVRDGAATDMAGNDVQAGPRLIRVFDGTRPTARVELAPGQSATTRDGTVRYWVTFSELVSGFDAADVIVDGPGSVTGVTGDGRIFEVVVSGVTDGTTSIRVADGAGTDAVGNPSVGSAGPTVTHTDRFPTSPNVAAPLPTDVAVSTSGPNGPQVRLFDPTTGSLSAQFDPFPGFRGGVSVGRADVTGDGIPDLLVGAGRGGAPHVKLIDGATGSVLYSFFAYDPGFTGGVNVAVGDVTGDGVADMVVAAGAGGGPHVRVFDGKTGQFVHSFFAYAPGFTGGVNVAVADVNADGHADIITGTGQGGAAHVKVFDGASGAESLSFFAYDPGFTGGVNVAAADFTGDGVADIVTGTGPGGGPHVKVFDGRTGGLLAGFMAYDVGFTGGVSVTAADVNSDGVADVVTGTGPGGAPHVKVFSGGSFAPLSSFFGADVAFRGGVNVG
jgi:hypothetical protein